MAGMTSVSRTADTTDPAQELRQRWAVTVAKARGTKNPTAPDPAPYADNLLSRWREPQRRYHTVGHLTAVLYRIDELAQHADDLPTVQLAAWFHDAVYRPDRSENEERSAALAERALPELGIGPARTAEVARLVRLTVTHDPAPDDPDGEVLCDADLAVLAGSPTSTRPTPPRSVPSTPSYPTPTSSPAAPPSCPNSSPCPACSGPPAATTAGNTSPAATSSRSWICCAGRRASGASSRRGEGDGDAAGTVTRNVSRPIAVSS